MVQYSYNSNNESKFHLKGEIIFLDKQYPRDSGWTWFVLEDDDDGETYHVSGVTNVYLMQGLKVEMDVSPGKIYKGEQQYSIQSHVQCVLNTRKDIVSYLSSNAFPHIGERTANILYDTYGSAIFDKVESDLDDVVKTCHLSSKQATSLFEGIVQESAEGMLHRVFPSLSDVIVRKIAKNHQNDIDEFVDSVQRNPYELLECGVAFRQVDKLILDDLHWRIDNDIRMLHIFNHTLAAHTVSEYDAFGNLRERNTKSIYLNLSTDFMFYFNYVCRGNNAYPMPDNVDSNWFYNQLEHAIHSSNKLKKVEYVNAETGQKEYHLYDNKMFYAKRYLETFIVQEANGSSVASINFQKILPTLLHNYQVWLTSGNSSNVGLNDGQRLALHNIIRNRISFVTGGPGRGKTTLVRALVDAWNFIHDYDCDIILLAPTGKAVKKLKDDANYGECQTITRFTLMNTVCKSKPDDALVLMDGCTYAVNGLRTLVVIDESSMLDYIEAAQLLQLIKDCTVVFLGDVNQLAPIEPGCFFNDMKVMDVFKFSVLTQNMRTKVAVLSDNNDKILDGTLTPKDYDASFGFDFTIPSGDFNANSNADILSCEKVVRYYQDALQRGYSLSDILLLSPARKGAHFGVNALNNRLQDLVNPLCDGDIDQYKVRGVDGEYYLVRKGFECPNVKLGESSVRIMDRVMNTKNDAQCKWIRYENDVYGAAEIDDGKGLFNGDVGTVERYIFSMRHTNPQVVVRMDDGRYFVMDVTDFKSVFTIAYATTVHKAQGSEASIVIVALSETSTFYPDGFLTKNLLYTATTRAKEEVQIVGSKKAFDICLRNEQIMDKSTLVEDVLRHII